MNHFPIIFLHGALGSKEQFEGLRNSISHTPTFAFNFDGHGDTPTNHPYSTSLFVDNLDSFMQKNQIDQAHIFGYSMGGYVALSFALKFPERVGKILTLATKFDWTPESAAKESKMLDPQKIEEKVPHFAQALKERHDPLDWKEVLNKTAEMMINLGNGAGLSDQDLNSIQNEVLISRGSEDRMVNEAESKKAANLIPNGSFHTIEGGKHPIERVDLEMLSKIINQYLV